MNFDGALAYAPSRDETVAASYTQVFRNGAIEGVEAVMLRREHAGGEHLIPSLLFERTLIGALDLYFALTRELGVAAPFFLALSLLDVRGLRMAVDASRFLESEHRIDRDDLLVPEVLIEDSSVEPARLLRPAFDAVWNAAGWPGSTNYDDDGNWHDR